MLTTKAFNKLESTFNILFYLIFSVIFNLYAERVPA